MILGIDPSAENCGIVCVSDKKKLAFSCTLNVDFFADNLRDNKLIKEAKITKIVIETPLEHGFASNRKTVAAYNQILLELARDIPDVPVHLLLPGMWKPFATAQGWLTAKWGREQGVKDKHQLDALAMVFYFMEVEAYRERKEK